MTGVTLVLSVWGGGCIALVAILTIAVWVEDMLGKRAANLLGRTVPLEVRVAELDPDLSLEIDEDLCWLELEQRVMAASAPNPRFREVHGDWYAHDRRLARERREQRS